MGSGEKAKRSLVALRSWNHPKTPNLPINGKRLKTLGFKATERRTESIAWIAVIDSGHISSQGSKRLTLSSPKPVRGR
jgi:hypothetical protein